MIGAIKKIVRTLLPFRKQVGSDWFQGDYETLTSQAQTSDNRFTLSRADFYPCLKDRTTTTPLDRHYIYHPAWAARVIARTQPSLHIDISSTLHFSTLLSAFVKTEFYDFRPAPIELENFHSGKADLTKLFFADNSLNSLSCMHTIEHVGLGRYGDAVDYDGDLKAVGELTRVLAPQGCLLFVVPVGKEAKICFNAHRVYTASDVCRLFENRGLKLVEFAYIPENVGGLAYYDSNSLESFATEESYGCGCFWFTK